MGFTELKNYAISDILSVSGKDKTSRVIENHMNNMIEIALIKGAQSRQAEIDELKNQIEQLKQEKLDQASKLDKIFYGEEFLTKEF